MDSRCKGAAAPTAGQRLLLFAMLVFLANVSQLQLAQCLNTSLGLCASLVTPWGYPCTDYTVKTEDGFLLGVQNIPHGLRNNNVTGVPRKPVFLQHGIFAGGDNWVFNAPTESLGFILADAGFDVWIGNIRCIVWSHGHASLSGSDEDYWDWSWDELAAYDIPAMVGFVHNRTNSRVSYVGHSQGTSILMAGLVGTAQGQSLTNMLARAVLISPIAYMAHISSEFDKIASEVYLDVLAQAVGLREFNLHNDLGVELIQETCQYPGINCTDVYNAVIGKDCCRNESQVPYYLDFFPQPTSTKNLGHFAQIIRKNVFSMYDYGFFGNLKRYKRLKPPVYNLSNFPAAVPVMVVQGGRDDLADATDVQTLVVQLGSTVKQVVVVERYSHGDFLTSMTAKTDIYPQIISFLQNP